MPADLYAIFNNAKLSAEEIDNKANAVKSKEALSEAKKELLEKQEAELKALAEEKLNQKNNVV